MYGTEHEDGERERDEKHGRQRDGREDSVILYPAGKAFPRTEEQRGEFPFALPLLRVAFG
jgi:hypothetical protein